MLLTEKMDVKNRKKCMLQTEKMCVTKQKRMLQTKNVCYK